MLKTPAMMMPLLTSNNVSSFKTFLNPICFFFSYFGSKKVKNLINYCDFEWID